MTLLAMKEEKQLEIWASSTAHGKQHFIQRYAIKRLSEHADPKQREGDKQVM